MPEPTTETKETQETKQVPEFGLSGRKIILDKDGKPCRTCNSLLDFQFATTGTRPKKTETKQRSTQKTKDSYAKDIPPDVEQLGKSSWTLLHSIAATYPETPTDKKQADLKQFLKLFGNFYPCWYCGDDFSKYIEINEPKVESQDSFGRWLCDAHNEVNVKLGKPKFDCNLWKQRWKDGWDQKEN